MKTILSIIFALALGAAFIANAATLPFVDKALQPEPTPPEAITLPEPSALETDWWQYFTVEDEELEQHIQEELQRLEKLLTELPEEIAAAARPYVELIRTNLQTLPKARAQPNPEPPTPPAYAESYMLSELLDIAERLRKTQAELQSEREDVAAMSKAVKAASRRLDTMVAAYLGLNSSNPQRVLRGLEIMAERTSIAVAEERLRIRRAAIASDEVLVEQLAEQQTVAAKRLVAEPGALARLSSQIDETQAALEEAQNQFINAQAGVLSVVGEDPEEKATAQYRQQRALRAAVKEAAATLQLLKLQAELDIASLLLDKEEPDFEKLRLHLSEWDAQLSDIRQRIVSWRSSSERERDRAGELVAGAPRDTDAAALTFIKLLNQDRLNLAQETLVALQRLEGEIAEAGLLMQVLNTQLSIKEGRVQAWLAQGKQIINNLWNTATGSVSTSLFKIADTPVTTLGLLRVVLIITIAWWISYWLRHALKRLGERGEGTNLPAYYTVGRLSHYVIIAIGFMVGLSSIGVDFTNFALFAGAIAIGIGFGLQSIVNNFVSGLILLFDRSLKVGDFVELASGVAGEVREIKVRSTVINTNDNVDIVVPNSEFMNTQVTNWTLLEAYRRIHIPFKVAYGTDKELVRKAGLEAAEKLPHTLLGVPGRNPSVWLVKFGDSSLDFELVVWVTPRAVKRPQAVHAAYMWEIETALRNYGIEIPLPQRDLRLRSGFEEAIQPRRLEKVEIPLSARLEKS